MLMYITWGDLRLGWILSKVLLNLEEIFRALSALREGWGKRGRGAGQQLTYIKHKKSAANLCLYTSIYKAMSFKRQSAYEYVRQIQE